MPNWQAGVSPLVVSTGYMYIHVTCTVHTVILYVVCTELVGSLLLAHNA